MASAKRVPAPVKASSIPDKATKAAPKTPRASIERGEREHAGVKAAVKRGQRLRMQSVKHSAALARG